MAGFDVLDLGITRVRAAIVVVLAAGGAAPAARGRCGGGEWGSQRSFGGGIGLSSAPLHPLDMFVRDE